MPKPQYTLVSTDPPVDDSVLYPRVPGADRVENTLRAAFPYGHAQFIPTMLAQVELHSNKNHDYARGGNPLGNFNRVASILALYPNFPVATPEGVAFIYALKQLDAEAWSMCQGGECKVEGLDERTTDQAIYANLRKCMRSERTPEGR